MLIGSVDITIAVSTGTVILVPLGRVMGISVNVIVYDIGYDECCLFFAPLFPMAVNEMYLVFAAIHIHTRVVLAD
jgi:hypothetical protein